MTIKYGPYGRYYEYEENGQTKRLSLQNVTSLAEEEHIKELLDNGFVELSDYSLDHVRKELAISHTRLTLAPYTTKKGTKTNIVKSETIYEHKGLQTKIAEFIEETLRTINLPQDKSDVLDYLNKEVKAYVNKIAVDVGSPYLVKIELQQYAGDAFTGVLHPVMPYAHVRFDFYVNSYLMFEGNKSITKVMTKSQADEWADDREKAEQQRDAERRAEERKATLQKLSQANAREITVEKLIEKKCIIDQVAEGALDKWLEEHTGFKGSVCSYAYATTWDDSTHRETDYGGYAVLYDAKVPADLAEGIASSAMTTTTRKQLEELPKDVQDVVKDATYVFATRTNVY